MAVFASDAEFLSPPVSSWLAGLRGQLQQGGAGGPPELLGPVTAISELARLCEAMLAGRGGPHDDDRKSLSSDVKTMRGALGPEVATELGPPLNLLVADVSPGRLKTPQGARSIQLAVDVVRGRLEAPAIRRAAWRDVAAAFRDCDREADFCEHRIKVLRELCELSGHEWGTFGVAKDLERVISDDALTIRAAQDESVRESHGSEFAGLSEDQRLELCEEIVAREPERGDVAVWLLYSDAYVHFWQRLGPIEFYDVRLVPDGLLPKGSLDGAEGYTVPPEIEDWDSAQAWLGQLPIATEEQAVLARVSLPDVVIERAPDRAREIVRSLVEIANEESAWQLHDGAAAFGPNGWFGSTFMDHPREVERRSGSVHRFFEPTRRHLRSFDDNFVARLASEEPIAEEAVEDAQWVIAVARAPTAAQRVALGTRALERVLSISQADGEHWTTVTTRYLKAPWLQLQVWRWVQASAVNARLGVSKTHGRGSELYHWVDHRVHPRDPDEHGVSYQSPRGVADLQAWFGPLEATMARGLIEYRTTRSALVVLNRPDCALAWLKEAETRFTVLLSRVQRARNAIIHGQRPSRQTLETIDGFVRDLGRLVAAEMMRSAETGDAPLLDLERQRMGLADIVSELENGIRPVATSFFGE